MDKKTKLREARRKLLKLKGEPESLVELKELKEAILELTKKEVVETKVIKSEILPKTLIGELKSLGGKIDELIKKEPPSSVKVSNLDELGAIKIELLKIKKGLTNLPTPQVNVTQRKVKLPVVQKVKVNNFPNEIPNKITIEKDDYKKPRFITEEYDKFSLEYTFKRDDKRTTITTKRT